MTRSRGWRRIRGAALGAAVACMALACGDQETPIASDDSRNRDADQVMVGLRHVITTDGVRRAMLEADTAWIYEDSAVVRVRPVKLTMYNERGEEQADLTAERGTLNSRTEGMVARGDVELVMRAGARRVETEVLHFEPNRDRIWSDVETTIHRDGSTFHGTSFTSNADLTDVELRDPRGTATGLEFDL